MGKIYWILAVPSTAIFLILLILSFFGGDADGGDVDLDVSDSLGGFIINFKSIMSFVMMFGWAGIISMSFNLSIGFTIIVAVLTGIVSLIAVAALLYFISKMSYSGTMKIENAIGKVGQVVLKIPAKKSGFGQIQVNIQGSLRTLDAKTEEVDEIKSGTNVQVIDLLENDVLLVVTKI
jgi:membrane protein implicated in regulation of membrane protease activity